jgi:hypothetical protein
MIVMGREWDKKEEYLASRAVMMMCLQNPVFIENCGGFKCPAYF